MDYLLKKRILLAEMKTFNLLNNQPTRNIDSEIEEVEKDITYKISKHQMNMKSIFI